jgi:NAD(P)-dependent dehydrogenase (short-subunit alcohol dehydrogenase family)
VAVVLGAGTGVGQAAALALARLGATVATADRDALAVSGTAVLGDKGDGGGQVHDYPADVADQAAVERCRSAVAAAISFFASDAASFITGQVLSVSGGLAVHG